MVGGNNWYYSPSQELYVRWVQLSVFLPTIEFSLTPWSYGANSEVVDRVKEALVMRKKLLPVIEGAAVKYNITGEPIIRPLWWYGPEDNETFLADTEFIRV